ncbi:MliC family protein [Dyella sp. 2HG41-7]|uniref:MliC family protein n=1 Tax=Dyella sp. 2HG41-7 TaxID=2883239 RepID=UPI001F32C280|nr:MliC family protein [Dyella sp. 2HG41-7]
MIVRSAFFVSIVALTGCGSTPTDTAAANSTVTWVNYACSDGQTLLAAYPDTNTALIQIKGQTHTLHIALSGSGARYTGDGWQWWTKGMHDGMLAPLAAGESIASSPGVQCQAR